MSSRSVPSGNSAGMEAALKPVITVPAGQVKSKRSSSSDMPRVRSSESTNCPDVPLMEVYPAGDLLRYARLGGSVSSLAVPWRQQGQGWRPLWEPFYVAWQAVEHMP